MSEATKKALTKVNLLKNPCGDERFDYWLVNRLAAKWGCCGGFTRELNDEIENIESPSVTELAELKELVMSYNEHLKQPNTERNENQGIVIETEHNGSKPLLDENGKVLKNFATTFFYCEKFQVIDLHENGFDEESMKTLKPKIEIKDYYNSRFDSGADYTINVELLNKDYGEVDSFAYKETLEPRSEEWKHVEHVFQTNTQNVRYIIFRHGGKDSNYWAGNYGVKLSNSSVKILGE